MDGLLTKRTPQHGDHANKAAEAAGGQEGRGGSERRKARCRPTGGDQLSSAGGKLNNEVELTAFDAALEDRKGLAVERVMGRRDTNLLEVSAIQPRSMLVAVAHATASGQQ